MTARSHPEPRGRRRGLSMTRWNRVFAARVPGMAFQQPPSGQPDAPKDAVRFDGFHRVARTGWVKTAAGSKPWRDHGPIESNREQHTGPPCTTTHATVLPAERGLPKMPGATRRPGSPGGASEKSKCARPAGASTQPISPAPEHAAWRDFVERRAQTFSRQSPRFASRPSRWAPPSY